MQGISRGKAIWNHRASAGTPALHHHQADRLVRGQSSSAGLGAHRPHPGPLHRSCLSLNLPGHCVFVLDMTLPEASHAEHTKPCMGIKAEEMSARLQTRVTGSNVGRGCLPSRAPGSRVLLPVARPSRKSRRSSSRSARSLAACASSKSSSPSASSSRPSASY